jgi:hypothetical protein
MYGKKGLVISIVTCIICIGSPLAWSGAITMSEVVYTISKLMILLYRMFKGYGNGAKAYHTVEVKHLNAISDYLEEFVDFADNKKYLLIASEYTAINRIMGLETPEKNEDAEIPCIQFDPPRAGDGNLGCQPHPLADANRACA